MLWPLQHVLGHVSLPYGAAPLAKPTAAHEDAIDGLHQGIPRSSLDAVRDSFLKIWTKSCDFLLETFHWFSSLLVKNSKLPWHQSSCTMCLSPRHASCPLCHPVCLGLPWGLWVSVGILLWPILQTSRQDKGQGPCHPHLSLSPKVSPQQGNM